MATWKKAVLVALAAVAGFVPVFTQITYAQTFPELALVLPSGEEVPDEELLEVEGEHSWVYAVGALIVAILTLIHGCTRRNYHSYEVQVMLDVLYAVNVFMIGAVINEIDRTMHMMR